jgi:LAS superfamily LD-carboxypeptidase LdcB
MKYTLLHLTGRDPSHLIDLPEFKNCRLTSDCASSFRKMHEDAQNDGLNIIPVSSFRNFERQLDIWNDKYLGDRPVYDNFNRPVNVNTLTGVETVYAILYWSALPGFSRHHWGTDIDIAASNLMPENYELKLNSEEYSPNGIFAPLTEWLDKNMQKYGFFRPFVDEAHVRVGTELWHISYRPDAEKFEKLITKDAIASIIRDSNIAGKACLINMVDELYDDYIIHG